MCCVYRPGQFADRACSSVLQSLCSADTFCPVPLPVAPPACVHTNLSTSAPVHGSTAHEAGGGCSVSPDTDRAYTAYMSSNGAQLDSIGAVITQGSICGVIL